MDCASPSKTQHIGAAFDGHVGDGHALIDSERGHAGTSEFQRRIRRAVRADAADQLQDHVFASDEGAGLAGQLDADAGGDAHPELAHGQGAGEVGGAEADAQRVEGASGAGVAIGAEDDGAVADHSEFRQQRMLDAAAAGFVVMRDAMLAGEVAHHGDGARRGHVRRGGEVVGYQDDALRVEGTGGTHGTELLEGQRAGDVVQQNYIGADGGDGAGVDGFRPLHRMRRQDFLRDRAVSHDDALHGSLVSRRMALPPETAAVYVAP